MTRYLERALAGEPASAADWNEHLVAFHTAFPNVTPELIRGFRTNDGRTSYEVLAQHVHESEPSARRIFDVGCGSGELLAELAVAFKNGVELAGVDLVATELDTARTRVRSATLLCQDVAEALPLREFDIAVAHLSILSMARLRSALRHIYAALRADGLLSFVIEDFVPESIIEMIAPAMRLLHKRHPTLDLSVPAGDGVKDDVTLIALLEATGFTIVDVDTIVLSAYLSAEEIAEFALMSYPLALLDESARAELQTNLRDTLVHLEDVEERILVKLPLKLVTARRSNAITNDKPPPVTEQIQ